MRRTRRTNKFNFKDIIINHISSNIKLYFTITIIFILGICLGVYFVNSMPQDKLEELNQYINQSITVIKEENKISSFQIFKKSALKNVIIVASILLFTFTILGGFILYAITLIIGCSLGYTISAIMATLSLGHGILFLFATMFFQNIIMIPTIMFLIVHGLKAREELISKNNTNIKQLSAKFFIYSLIVEAILIGTSLVEAYISSNLINWLIKYI